MSELFENTAEGVLIEPALPLPGAALRAAREASGYSLAEVSQALKFGVRQIEALENDDYSTLTGTTFIRGFVRSYARYLRLDEAPLLAALEPQAPVAVAEVRPVENIDAAMPVGNSGGNKRAYLLAVVVLLLGGGAWFFLQTQPQPKPVSEVAAPAASEQVQAPEPAVVEPPAKQPEVAPAASAVAPTPVVVPAAPAATPAPEAAPAVAAANANERQLVLSFSDVSWVEVRDASQRIIYSGRSTPDSRQVMRGRPPFQLVIGNAQAVKLRYEDRSIDLQPYTRVDVARLTLDDNTK